MQTIAASQITIHSLVSTCLLFFLLTPTTKAQQPPSACIRGANYTQQSQYKSNLDRALASLVSNIPPTGFNTITLGTTPDTVYGLLQCRGDVSHTDCQTCAKNTAGQIVQLCPYQKEAVVFNDDCMLHYAGFRFFSTTNFNPVRILVNVKNVSDPVAFNNKLEDLMTNLSRTASSDPSKFATGNTRFGKSGNIYGLVQCTRDLSETTCLGCLQGLIGQGTTVQRVGARVLSTSCNIRYEIYPFFRSSQSPSPPPPVVNSPPPTRRSRTTTPNGNSRKKRRMIIIISATLVAAMLVFGCCGYFYISKKKKRSWTLNEINPKGERSKDDLELPLFDLITISTATNNFSEENKLGEGGFGPVFKGKLAEGQEIAVKRLSTTSAQGVDEFKNEVKLISKLQHRNLVRLLGYCIQGEEKMLIYEYLPNKSLDCFIFDKRRSTLLDWQKRFQIILGIARGLLYLHHDSRLRIIHRDLKASNILLDNELEPKISDFGLARLFGGDQSEAITSRVVGTHGYMAPEYAVDGNFSIKSDVFSFGVLVLEILSGQKNRDCYDVDRQINLLGHAWTLWSEDKAMDLVDESMGNSFVVQKVVRCIHIGLLCVQQSMQQRPTMSSVVLMLNSNDMVLPQPEAPAFYIVESKPNIYSSDQESFSLNDASITTLDGR